MPRCFEDYRESEVVLSQGRTITETDVVSFASLTADWNEIHTNEEFARTGFYGRRIAHGALIFSISMGLFALNDRSQQPDLIAFYGVDRLRFIKPVFLGDTIRLKQTVQSLEAREEKAGGIVNLAHDVLNQTDVVVVSYTAKLLVRRRS
ncbi:MAG: MaoC family dehydratase N-terminal domain-containing protein [Acidobacteria bacterium]|nr:MaoC family dehydratase N-terminal domain-containing protein [Acidobacteriota bacterium]